LPGSLPLPARLGRYPIHGLLGAGSKALVYKALDPYFDRAIALKTMRRELMSDEDEAAGFREMFGIEAQAGGRLGHRGIVAVYEYGEDGGFPFIAMEYVQGCSLRRCFERKVLLREADVVSIMAQLLDALEHMHERGVWHRCIKPADLLIASDGRLKLADFGCAHVEGTSRTHHGSMLGSADIIAPELFPGREVDHRVDLFAAGVVLYELLTGEPPFAGSKEGLRYKVCHEATQRPSVVAGRPELASFDAVALRALAKRPRERYPSASEFRADLLATWARPVGEVLPLEALAQMGIGPA
jgi:serine/threonine protein kinase